MPGHLKLLEDMAHLRRYGGFAQQEIRDMPLQRFQLEVLTIDLMLRRSGGF